MPPSAQHHRFAEIDALRGFAALWVVLSHYLPYWNRYLGPAPIIVPNEWGIYAVKLFFVISGFVIFTTLDRCQSALDFAVNRISRLYPSYWATLFIATLASVLIFGDQFWLGGFVVNTTMLQDFLGYSRFDIVYWSLTVELAFYLLAGCLFALRLHQRPFAILTTWLIASSVWALNVQVSDTEHRGYIAMLFALDYSPYFAMGIVFFDVTKHGWSRLAAGVIILAVATEFLIAGWPGLCVALTSALLFSLAIMGRLRFLVSKVTLWLGAISYALYLIHRNLGYKALSWLHEQQLGPALAVPLAILGALLLATLITYGVEKPALKTIRVWYAALKAQIHS